MRKKENIRLLFPTELYHPIYSGFRKKKRSVVRMKKNSALFSRYSAAIVGRSKCRDAIVNFHAIGATNAIPRYCAAKCE